MEYRAFRAQAVSTDEGVIEGLVTPFNAETVIGDLKYGGFREQIAPGAFRKTLHDGDPVMVYQHDMAMPLARVSAGNLTLREGTYEGQKGLVVHAEPVQTSYAQDMRALVDAKVLGGFSFGFRVVKDDWTDDDGKPASPWDGTNRTIREVQLIEVSPVTNPAYTQTKIAARSAVDEARGLDERGGNAPGNGKKPYGNVKYADPGFQKDGKKRYPLDTKKHVTAAWDYIHVASNREPYTAAQLAHIEGAIKAAAPKFGVKLSDKKSAAAAMEDRMKKASRLRVVEIEAELKQALDLLAKDDGDELKQARALVSSAVEHIGHIKHDENVGDDGKKKPKRSQEPDTSTPDNDEADNALRDREIARKERSRELGYV